MLLCGCTRTVYMPAEKIVARTYTLRELYLRVNFTTTAKGTPIIRLVQQKTRNKVKIPIMNPNLEAICKKYEYNLQLGCFFSRPMLCN